MSSRVTAAARTHLRSLRVKIWAGLLALLALWCAFLPLVGVLGYTFAFVMAVVASVAAADLAAALARRSRAVEPQRLDHATGPGRLVAELFGRAALVNLALLAAPFFLLTLNALRVRNCDYGFGLQAYFGLTILSALAGTAVGIATETLAGRRRILANALPYAAIVAWWLHAVWRFYAAPPVFVYNAFGGFFPGNLYDENLSLTGAFWWSRAYQTLVAVSVLAVVAMLLDTPSVTIRWLRERRPIGVRRRPTAIAAAAAATAALVWFDSGDLGFDVDAGDIQHALGGRRDTEHFVIYYPTGGDIEKDIDLIADDHELRYLQAVRAFDLVPGGDPITSYYFESPEQKRRWFGAERVHMAKPWAREIFVNHDSFPHNVLRHEIAHVVAGAFGDDTFGVSVKTVLGVPALFSVGLIEGAAVAADWPGHRSELTPHQAVRALRELDYEPPVEELFSTGFFQFSSSRSYTTAGSFVYFLLTEYGAPRFRALYRSGGDFRAAYGRGLGELAAEWRAAIDATILPPGTAEAVRERFRRRAVFERPCPHAIARKRRRIAEHAVRGEREDAIELSREVCRDSPGEPRYRLDLAQLLLAAERLGDARAEYAEIAANDNWSTSIRAEAMLRLSDLAGREDDVSTALAHLDAAAALPLDHDTLRQIVARREAAVHAGPAGPHLRAYFWRHPIDSTFDAAVGVARAGEAARLEPELALPRYLIGLQLYNKRAWEDAVLHLRQVLDMPAHPLIARRNAAVLAIAAYRTGDYDTVLRAAAVLEQPEQPEMVRFSGADWRERVAWKRTGYLIR
jgi:hypothetical protein